MQKDPKRTNPHTARNVPVAWTINIAGPDDDVRDPKPLAILGEDFILFDFCEAIGVSPELGTLFNGARLIQQPPPRFL